MKIRGLLLAGLMLGVSSFAYLKAYAGGTKSAPPPAAGQLFSKPVRASSLTTDSGARNRETLDVAAAHKEASAGAAHADATCTSGSVASGVYSNLNIAGTCFIDAGSVTVEHNLTVLSGENLIAIFGGSDVMVGGNIVVEANGVLILGCEPIHFICANDPDQTVGSLSTADTVGGNLTSESALAVIVHATIIGRNVSLNGGGGGVSCIPSPVLGGSPPFTDSEDVTIGGNLTITGLQTCFIGVFRNTITQNFVLNGNVDADPDGNELADNSIVHNLNCAGNSPSPQIGDSGGGPSTVFGRANGQCNNPTLVQH